jgi:hypothetical protein
MKARDESWRLKILKYEILMKHRIVFCLVSGLGGWGDFNNKDYIKCIIVLAPKFVVFTLDAILELISF